VSDVESDSHWQQNDYKSFNPSVDWDTVDFSKSPAIQDMPVTSAICEPSNNTIVKVSKKDGNVLNVKGYAWAGSGNKIIRVDLTPDKGRLYSILITTRDLGESHIAFCPPPPSKGF
jgi:sulfite oxidase